MIVRQLYGLEAWVVNSKENETIDGNNNISTDDDTEERVTEQEVNDDQFVEVPEGVDDQFVEVAGDGGEENVEVVIKDHLCNECRKVSSSLNTSIQHPHSGYQESSCFLCLSTSSCHHQ